MCRPARRQRPGPGEPGEPGVGPRTCGAPVEPGRQCRRVRGERWHTQDVDAFRCVGRRCTSARVSAPAASATRRSMPASCRTPGTRSVLGAACTVRLRQARHLPVLRAIPLRRRWWHTTFFRCSGRYWACRGGLTLPLRLRSALVDIGMRVVAIRSSHLQDGQPAAVNLDAPTRLHETMCDT